MIANSSAKLPRVLGVSTLGKGSRDEDRLRTLLKEFAPEFFPFDRQSKRRSFFRLLRTIRRELPDLVVMEGTGIAGGLALLLGRFLAGVPYVVSSGDAVGPWVASHVPLLGPVFTFYERLLCRCSAGFIGWTPYLTGRALTFGAPRAMTAAGWASFTPSAEELAEGRRRVREQLGIPADALVFGLVGSLVWTRRVSYCYGLELVQAMLLVKRPDVRVLVVGEGTGRARLAELAAGQLNQTIFLPGQVARKEIPNFLAAMDVASLPQSLDGVGSFRYTTKLPEYLTVGLPIVTGQIPLAYDLGKDWLWRLPGKAPWDRVYIEALSELMTQLTWAEVDARRAAIPREWDLFDQARQIARVTDFLMDLMNARKTIREKKNSLPENVN